MFHAATSPRFTSEGGLILSPEETTAITAYLLASTDDDYRDKGLSEAQGLQCLGVAALLSDVHKAAEVLRAYGVDHVRSLAAVATAAAVAG